MFGGNLTALNSCLGCFFLKTGSKFLLGYIYHVYFENLWSSQVYVLYIHEWSLCANSKQMSFFWVEPIFISKQDCCQVKHCMFAHGMLLYIDSLCNCYQPSLTTTNLDFDTVTKQTWSRNQLVDMEEGSFVIVKKL